MAASSWREPAPPAKLVEIRCRWCRTLIVRVDAEKARVEAICPDRRCRRGQTHRVGGDPLQDRTR